MNKSLLALALLTVSSGALAQSPNWNNVEVSYLDTTIDVDESEPSFDGLGLSGSAIITENWIVFADYKTIEADANGASSDLEMLSTGAGAFKRVTDSTDIYTTISVERLDISGSANGFSVSDDEIGFGIGIGVRSMLAPLLEVDAKIDYVDIDDTDVFRARANAFYHFSEQLSAGIGFETYRPSDVDLDIDTVSVSLRYTF
tara:strand:- start:177 stop:779 length:603 start_codon:yes stop_codon:yes gene_type:complete